MTEFAAHPAGTGKSALTGRLGCTELSSGRIGKELAEAPQSIAAPRQGRPEPTSCWTERTYQELLHAGQLLAPAWCLRALQPVFSGTTSTGSVDLCTTSCATLPSSMDVTFERPRVPTTISPA